MHPDDITKRIRIALPDAEVYYDDLTGTQNHWKIDVISSHFEGKRLLAQHRLVKDALADELKSNVIHALSVKTFTPQQWKARA